MREHNRDCEKFEKVLLQIEAILRYRSCVCGLDVHKICVEALPVDKLLPGLEEFLEPEEKP